MIEVVVLVFGVEVRLDIGEVVEIVDGIDKICLITA